MNLKSIHHIAIICSDYQKSKQFYTEVLGLQILKETYRVERNSYKLDLALNGNYLIELFSFPNPPKRLTNPEALGLRHNAFAVDDLDEVADELTQKNIPLEPIRIDPVTGRRFFFFKDPDDLPIEMYES